MNLKHGNGKIRIAIVICALVALMIYPFLNF